MKKFKNLCLYLLAVCFDVVYGLSFIDRYPKAGDFPNVVAIFWNEGDPGVEIGYVHTCAGVLITTRFTFTLRTCVGGQNQLDPKKFRVSAGLIDFDKNEEYTKGFLIVQNRTGEAIVTDPSFKTHPFIKGFYYNDQALIKTAPFIMTPQVLTAKFERPPMLWLYDSERRRLESATKTCWIVGWGATEVNEYGWEVHSRRLIAMKVNLISEKKCNYYWCYNYPLYCDTVEPESNGIMCAAGIGVRGSVCHGDAGDPLFCSGYFYGLAIFFPHSTCNGNSIPDAYVAPKSFLNFLQNITGIKDEANTLQLSFCLLFSIFINSNIF